MLTSILARLFECERCGESHGGYITCGTSFEILADG